MTPMPGFVRDLRAYDPMLRVRWAQHTGQWLIERKLPPRSRQYLREQPHTWTSARQRDVWESWKDGYLHVAFVRKDLLHWPLVEPFLRALDREAQGGTWDQLMTAMDEADEAMEQDRLRAQQNEIEAVTSEAYDDLAWMQKRRVAGGLPSHPE